MASHAKYPGSDRTFLVLVSLLALSYPLFVDTYRAMAFPVVPRDDYAPLLLSLAGEDGHLLDAPFGYRVLSVLVALPFYHLLPLYKFSLLPADAAEPYLRATQALAFVSYLSAGGTAAILFRTTTRRLQGSATSGLVAALLSYFFIRFTSLTSVDPFGVFFVALSYHFATNRRVFTLLMLVSAAVNEKISLVFLLLFALRALTGHERRLVLPPLLGMVAYAGLVGIVDLPGSLVRTAPAGAFLENVALSVSQKGLILNLAPPLILLAGYGTLAWSRLLPYSLHYRRSDFLVPILLAGIAMALDVQLNVGRVASYAFPFLLPAFSLCLTDGGLLATGARSTGRAADPPTKSRP
jgi:hypothetical protein